jgi:hypothetical protein
VNFDYTPIIEYKGHYLLYLFYTIDKKTKGELILKIEVLEGIIDGFTNKLKNDLHLL